ncbi:hypothetical protein OEZ85_013296 [Tetradesmus obliquus]|uniref:Retrotransposon gag domain-containing protein n=1 Tax=Tetradesmus obliquus TaxID=3088 RepID=A0ABY8U599_TETOB|nr:hypothetical protein OEZ85_013296 [Tetradesmus obliquus]
MQAEEAEAMQDDAGTDAAQNADTVLHAAPPPASNPDPSYTPSSAETSPATSEENENLLDGLSSDDDMAPASTASDESKANYRREIMRLQEVAIQANEAAAAAQAAAAQARQAATAAEERAQTAEALYQSVAEQLGRSDAVIAGVQEVQARNRLLGLKQGGMSVTDYINEFDSCYNHLPSWDEQEKVHKFLSGLNKTWKERCWINPLTGKRWTAGTLGGAFGNQYIFHCL